VASPRRQDSSPSRRGAYLRCPACLEPLARLLRSRPLVLVDSLVSFQPSSAPACALWRLESDEDRHLTVCPQLRLVVVVCHSSHRTCRPSSLPMGFLSLPPELPSLLKAQQECLRFPSPACHLQVRCPLHPEPLASTRRRDIRVRLGDRTNPLGVRP
jgi:hypothetical protein